jgi:hypothetical protein
MKIVYNCERASKEEITWLENNLSYILRGNMSTFREGVMNDYILLRVTLIPKLLEEGTSKSNNTRDCNVLCY